MDNLVGVGFSYSDSGDNGLITTQSGYGEDLHSFAKQFFRMFPEYRSRDFNITGLSFAGRYIPSLTIRIHEDCHNDVRPTGIYLGGPYFDMHDQMDQYFEHLYSAGAISYAHKNILPRQSDHVISRFPHRANQTQPEHVRYL